MCSEHDNLLFDKVIKDMNDDDLKSSHTLIELSHKQWKSYRDNSIIVIGIKEENRISLVRYKYLC